MPADVGNTKTYILKYLFLTIAFLSIVVVLNQLNIQLSFAQSGNGELLDDPEARKIFEELDRRREQVTYERTQMEMTIVNSKGNKRIRSMRSFTYDKDNINKNLIVFSDPADVRGTAFLTITEGDDEIQKLYLPSINRIQVISGGQKSDRFMGSDFTYEDLGAQNPEEYNFELLARTDTVNILKAKKKDNSQYDYIHFYIHPERYTLQKAEYFKNGDEPIKRLIADDYKQVLKNVWRANTMTMYDLEENRRTTLEWSGRNINEEIPGWRFTERALRRGIR